MSQRVGNATNTLTTLPSDLLAHTVSYGRISELVALACTSKCIHQQLVTIERKPKLAWRMHADTQSPHLLACAPLASYVAYLHIKIGCPINCYTHDNHTLDAWEKVPDLLARLSYLRGLEIYDLGCAYRQSVNEATSIRVLALWCHILETVLRACPLITELGITVPRLACAPDLATHGLALVEDLCRDRVRSLTLHGFSLQCAPLVVMLSRLTQLTRLDIDPNLLLQCIDKLSSAEREHVSNQIIGNPSGQSTAIYLTTMARLSQLKPESIRILVPCNHISPPQAVTLLRMYWPAGMS
jgi:hypothetical protein